MNTPVEYAKLAEALLDQVPKGLELDRVAITMAQVYATLAQASATVELQKSVRVTNSGVGW
jgi:hypothetical protein